MKLKLLVFVIGLDSSFPVTIQSLETVDDLKKAIVNEKSNDLKDVDPSGLTLFKVSLPDDETLKRLTPQTFQEEIKPSHELSKLFPEKPPETISIVVKLPDDFEKGECRFDPLPSCRSAFLFPSFGIRTLLLNRQPSHNASFSVNGRETIFLSLPYFSDYCHDPFNLPSARHAFAVVII